jgi:hypothetical protein
MPDPGKKFHEFALQSVLFKGRSDWYFCYLKTEKIAHVLLMLAQAAGSGRENDVLETARRAASLPGEIAHLAAGEVDIAVVLADLFSILSTVRMLSTRGSLAAETAAVLVREYETVSERLMRGSHPSPFVSSDDFSVPALGEPQSFLSHAPLSQPQPAPIKDNKTKGQDKGQSDRMSLILELVRKRRSLSIKEIAAVIKDCSEKTIQRELNILIERGLIRREGERRWSVYVPA